MGSSDIDSREPDSKGYIAGFEDRTHGYAVFLIAGLVGTFKAFSALYFVRLPMPTMRADRLPIPPLLYQELPASGFILKFRKQVF